MSCELTETTTDTNNGRSLALAWTVNHSNPFVDIDVRSYFFSPDGKGMPVLMRGLVWRGHAASGPETTSSNAFAALFYRGEPSGRV